MALDDEDGHRDSGSHEDTSCEVSITDEEILEILEDNRKKLKTYAKLTRKLSAAYDKVCAKLAIANGKIEALSAPPPEPSESECSSCVALMGDLTELRSQYTQRVDERDACFANLEATK